MPTTVILTATGVTFSVVLSDGTNSLAPVTYSGKDEADVKAQAIAAFTALVNAAE